MFAHSLNVKTSIWPIDRTLSGATTPGQSGPGSNGNEEVLRILQSSRIIGASPLDSLVSYTGHLLVCLFVCLGFMAYQPL